MNKTILSIAVGVVFFFALSHSNADVCTISENNLNIYRTKELVTLSNDTSQCEFKTTNDYRSIRDTYRDKNLNIRTESRRIRVDGIRQEHRIRLDGKGRERRIRLDGKGQERRIRLERKRQERRIRLDGIGQERRIRVDGKEQERRIRLEETEQERRIRGDGIEQERRVRGDGIEQERRVRVDRIERERRVRVYGIERERRVRVDDIERERRVRVDDIERERRVRVDGIEQERRVRVDGIEQERRVRVEGIERERRILVDGIERELKIRTNERVHERKLRFRTDDTSRTRLTRSKSLPDIRRERVRDGNERFVDLRVTGQRDLERNNRYLENRLDKRSREREVRGSRYERQAGRDGIDEKRIALIRQNNMVAIKNQDPSTAWPFSSFVQSTIGVLGLYYFGMHNRSAK